MPVKTVVIVGAGIGGLVSALLLAARGLDVQVLERAASPGGKLRQIRVGDQAIDSGPTVFTMRWVFDEIFAAVGASLDASLAPQPAPIIARHAWSPEERLDLFTDQQRSSAAIGDFAGARAARQYLDFCALARRVYEILEPSFIRASRPTLAGLLGRSGLRGVRQLAGLRSYASLWQALSAHFDDPRLRQLFGRYSTYCGSSPFAAPSTLMLIAHAEQRGVWLIPGGMHQIARVLAELATRQGARIRYQSEAATILIEHGRARGVQLATGERVDADAVLFNGDPAALGAGRLGETARRALAPIGLQQRSLSAITWSLLARTSGFPLDRHNVFFSRDYAAEFADIFEHGRPPRCGTVYVCAQDRGYDRNPPPDAQERLLVLLNAPARGDVQPLDVAEIDQCEQRAFSLLEQCGLKMERTHANQRVTTPEQFDQLFPATGGALYGPAIHGWKASFERPASRSRIPGLYLAGGSTHPGAGIPMAAMSARLACAALLEDLGST